MRAWVKAGSKQRLRTCHSVLLLPGQEVLQGRRPWLFGGEVCSEGRVDGCVCVEGEMEAEAKAVTAAVAVQGGLV